MSGSDEYNYTNFPVAEDVADFQAFPSVLRVGERAPDPELTDLSTSELISLSDITRKGMTIVEFGSLT
jgi:hypothetical protein